jgi:hypothetical protein
VSYGPRHGAGRSFRPECCPLAPAGSPARRRPRGAQWQKNYCAKKIISLDSKKFLFGDLACKLLVFTTLIVEKKMSAWLCSENHINLLAAFADNPPTTFKLLVAENIRSLEARYPGRDFLEEWKQEASQYKYNPETERPTDQTLIVKCCDCYDYQSCESDDWDVTEAYGFINAVRGVAIARGGKAKGPAYDAAPWGID